MERQRVLGYILVFTAATCWALTGILGKIAIRSASLSGLEVAFWRAALGGGLFIIHAFLTNQWRVSGKTALTFGLFGIPGIAGVMAFFLIGVEEIGVAMATMLQYTSTAWIAVWGVVFFKEEATAWRIGSVLMAIAGGVVLCLSGGDVLLGLTWAGVGASLLSGFCYSLNSAFGKKFLANHTAVTMYMYAMPVGALVMLPFITFGAKAGGDWLNLILLAVVTVWGAYWAYIEGVRRLEITKVGVICTIEPVIAALLAFALFDERLEWLGLVGSGMIVAAVLISLKK